MGVVRPRTIPPGVLAEDGYETAISLHDPVVRSGRPARGAAGAETTPRIRIRSRSRARVRSRFLPHRMSLSSRAGGRVGTRGTSQTPLVVRFSREPRGRRRHKNEPRDADCGSQRPGSGTFTKDARAAEAARQSVAQGASPGNGEPPSTRAREDGRKTRGPGDPRRTRELRVYLRHPSRLLRKSHAPVAS
jgi:hypothetical protein